MAKSIDPSEMGKKGGKARAEKLSGEERSKIARQAAAARWGNESEDPIEATHTGELKLGDITIPCAVLEDGSRILTQQGVLLAIGRARSAKGGQGASQGVDKLPAFLAASNLNAFISSDLRSSTKPIRFRVPSGALAYGYLAELLPQVCEVYLDARSANALRGRQVQIAQQCEILVRGFARVGITALVDEATGFQRDREQNALAKILEAFVANEIQKWLPTFPMEFYELVCEIRGEPLERARKRPSYLGKITNDLVYKRLAPGVLDELRNKNPVMDSGRRKHKHHQLLTPDLGHPKLREHLAGVVSILRAAKAQKMGWDSFKKLLDQTHPRQPKLPLFEDHLDD